MNIHVIDEHRKMTVTRIHFLDWNSCQVLCDIKEGNIYWTKVWIPIDKVYVNPMEVRL
jgi:hypothetical protein